MAAAIRTEGGWLIVAMRKSLDTMLLAGQRKRSSSHQGNEPTWPEKDLSINEDLRRSASMQLHPSSETS